MDSPSTNAVRKHPIEEIPKSLLDQCARFYNLKNHLRLFGIASMICGTLSAVALSVAGPSQASHPLLIWGLSLGLVMAGGILRLLPYRVLLFVNAGITLASVCVILSNILFGEPGSAGSKLLNQLSCFQFLYAGSCVLWLFWTRFWLPQFTSPTFALAKREINKIIAADPKQSSDFISLKQGGFFTPYGSWKIRMGAVVAAVFNQGRTVRFVSPEEFRLQFPSSQKAGKGNAHVRARIGGRATRASISPQDVTRYQRWLTATASLANSVSTPESAPVKNAEAREGLQVAETLPTPLPRPTPRQSPSRPSATIAPTNQRKTGPASVEEALYGYADTPGPGVENEQAAEDYRTASYQTSARAMIEELVRLPNFAIRANHADIFSRTDSPETRTQACEDLQRELCENPADVLRSLLVWEHDCTGMSSMEVVLTLCQLWMDDLTPRAIWKIHIYNYLVFLSGKDPRVLHSPLAHAIRQALIEKKPQRIEQLRHLAPIGTQKHFDNLCMSVRAAQKQKS